MADRLRPEDDRGQSNWADIDDDEEWAKLGEVCVVLVVVSICRPLIVPTIGLPSRSGIDRRDEEEVHRTPTTVCQDLPGGM